MKDELANLRPLPSRSVAQPATVLLGLGTAVPRYRIAQDEAASFMKRAHLDDATHEQRSPQQQRFLERRIDYLYRRSGIESRYTCCPEFADGAAVSAAHMTMAERMQRYEREVVPLSTQACQRALEQAGLAPTEITHVVFVTCTGFVAPGPDQQVARQLGLRPDVRRLQIGFMGCQAALHGLQVADAFCRSDPAARVLLVCAELCSLHFRNSAADEDLVANCLFADGAAAAILVADSVPAHLGDGALRIGGFESCVLPDSADLLTWRIGNRTFSMGLDPATPQALSKSLPAFTARLLATDHGSQWIVHPGGPAILDAAQEALQLPGEALASSRQVLREFGNMSSPTVLFVLQRAMQDTTTGQIGVAMSFGPGLSIEGMRFKR
jgi:alpha-pyrone synthase